MAQNFEIFIEDSADTSNHKQLEEIKSYMISDMAEDFARQGLTGRILAAPSEYTPGPNKKLLYVKMVDLQRGFSSTLRVDVTLKEGTTVLTSWQDAVRTGRSWEILARALNTRMAVKLRRYYAPSAPAPAQDFSQAPPGEVLPANTPAALPVPVETVEPF
jgi:hypothetical protein